MNIEMCIECDDPTGRMGKDEDSLYVGDAGPYCEDCFEYYGMMSEHAKEKEELKAEVERLKALNKMSEGQEVEAFHTWEQERAAVVAWLRLEPSYQNRPWDVITADIERGEHWPEKETP